MAEPLPTALKKPEISRFINRANQLRSIKPAIAYWCEYHAVNQIVGKSLHTADDDCFHFTRTLIERLEATKTERADDDAIVDNTAGQAYVEQFAQETFDRAERAMTADKVTRQTADTFDAAATFFDLTHEWGTPDSETLQKIKFAKWNAARILKAIREGKDPNESNPKRTEPEDQQPQTGDQADVPVDLTGESDNNTTNSHRPQPVSLQHVPDTGEPTLPQPPAAAPASDPSASASVPGEPFSPSPMTTSPPPQAASQPTPPPATDQEVPPLQPSPQIPTKIPSQFMPPTDPAAGPAPSSVGRAPPPAPAPAPAPAPIPHPAPAPAPAPVQQAPPAPPPQRAQPTTDMHHKDLNQAQKHAKWAISALNFEDVPTAVQELRNALSMLGAQ